MLKMEYLSKYLNFQNTQQILEILLEDFHLCELIYIYNQQRNIKKNHINRREFYECYFNKIIYEILETFYFNDKMEKYFLSK